MTVVTDPLRSSEARGKIGGTVYNTWRGKHVVATKRASTPQNADKQIAIRLLTAECVAAWKLLTDAQRKAWSTYGDTHLRSDWTGTPLHLAGYHYYIKYNVWLLRAGQPKIPAPPHFTPFPGLSIFSATWQPTYNLLTHDALLITQAAQARWEIYFAGPHSAGLQVGIEKCRFLIFRNAYPGSYTHMVTAAGKYTYFSRRITLVHPIETAWLKATIIRP
jgi:hypothetical protein